MNEKIRLQKYIADCGLASRRAAEKMIRDGEVTVNGKIISEMGFKIIPGKDAIKVRGKLIRQAQEMLYIAMYKPSGVLTTLHDPEERPTVKDYLRGIKERVFPVGRLDFDSEGLIILTNDGQYAQSVIHPVRGIKKVYIVKVKGKLEGKHLERLKTGVTLVEGKVKVDQIERIRNTGQYDWYKVILTEGRHRQVHRMFEKIGFDVLKLKRTAIGRLTIGRLERGGFKFLTKEQAELVLRP